MKQNQVEKEGSDSTYIFIYTAAGVPVHFGAVILETQHRPGLGQTGTRRNQPLLQADQAGPLPSPSQRLLLLCKPVTSPQVRSAQRSIKSGQQSPNSYYNTGYD